MASSLILSNAWQAEPANSQRQCTRSNMSGLLDQPMALGEHLEELRRRLMWVLIGLGLATVVAFGFQHEIKILVGYPLQIALARFDPEALAQIGIQPSEGAYRLRADAFAEPAIVAMKLSVFFAIAAMFPFLIYQLWGFIRPALERNEATAAFGFCLRPRCFFMLVWRLAFYWRTSALLFSDRFFAE